MDNIKSLSFKQEAFYRGDKHIKPGALRRIHGIFTAENRTRDRGQINNVYKLHLIIFTDCSRIFIIAILFDIKLMVGLYSKQF